jgi:hypothetical protein
VPPAFGVLVVKQRIQRIAVSEENRGKDAHGRFNNIGLQPV